MSKLESIHTKIFTPETIDRTLAYWRFKAKKIVFTNGCFDILHRGHIEYLVKARDEGDLLIVGLNTDNSVKKIKGPDRPVNDQDARALMLASLSFVDAVILFDEETPYELIKQIQPDVLVKGADYEQKEIIGADIVKAKGGEVKTIELVEGYSTSSIIRAIATGRNYDVC